jgi:regulator of sigma E protease
MEILGSVFDFVSRAGSFLIPFLFVLTIVVFVHELGHFLVARWCGIRVDSFSIGFGREIVGWTDKSGTRWRISLIPLGGYVKFFGDENAASQPVTEERLATLTPRERSESFHAKSVGQRAAVVAAGPIANFLLAIVVFAGLFTLVGRTIIEPRIGEVMTGTAAEQAGFRAGDLILSVDGRRVETFNDVQRLVATSNGRPVEVRLRRGGAEELTITANPREHETVDRVGRRHRSYILGLRPDVSPTNVEVRRYDPVTAIGLGVRETWFVVDRTVLFLRDLVIGRGSIEDLGGPIRIAEASGQAAAVSFAMLVSLMAVLSVSIGLLNLFPIPILDGGHLLFYAIEALRGRPLSERSQEIGFRLGLVVVLAIFVVAMTNDLSPHVARLLGS